MEQRMGEACADTDELMVMGTPALRENVPDFNLDYLELEVIFTLPSASLYRSSGLAIILAVSHMRLNVIQMPE
jgi:hypothetical protein